MENGFEVVNVDKSKLERAKRTGSLDTGAIMVLESLDLYCEDLIDAYDEPKGTEYRKLFSSLQCVIKSALESEKIRNAIMTGIIKDTSKQKVIEEYKTEKGKNTRDLNVDDVTDFAKDHNLGEIAAYFDLPSGKMRNYLNVHKISYIKKDQRNAEKEKLVRKLAQDMTVKQLASFFKEDYGTMYKYLRMKEIKCKK